MRKSGKKLFIIILLICGMGIQTAFAQQRVAILSTEDDGEPPLKHNELNVITAKLREIAGKILTAANYEIMTEQTILSYVGSQKEMAKLCEAADGCLAKIGRDIDADYVGQARISRFGKYLTVKMEIYDSKKGTLAISFTDESSKDIYALLNAIDNKTPQILKKFIEITAATAGNSLADSRNSKKYKTVKIGDQIWMAENLNHNVSGSKCYQNKAENCDKYGRLYNWSAAMKACPDDWHMPTKAEWETLTNYIERDKNCKNCDAKHIKEYGFAEQPGGYGYSDGFYDDLGKPGSYWWSATEINANYAYRRSQRYGNEAAGWNHLDKTYLHSVRCIKD